MGFGEVTNSEESQLEELRVRGEWESSRMERLHIRMRIIGEMIKGGGNRVVDWIWRLYNIAFESCVVSEDWRFAVIVPQYKGKGKRTECKN